MSKSKKIECKVIRTGFIISGAELEVGDTIVLTEKAVKSFVGKVKPIQEIKDEEKSRENSPKGFAALKKRNKELEAKIDALEVKLTQSSAKK